MAAAFDDGDTEAAEGKNYARTPTLWDADDDILLMHLKDSQKLGWKEIASNFVNRTPNACQFRWRRLKLGNLKHPPKLAAALASHINATNPPPQRKRRASSSLDLPQHSDINDTPFAYSPPLATFTGIDNSVSNALAGLLALSNSPSNVSSPGPTQAPPPIYSSGQPYASPPSHSGPHPSHAPYESNNDVSLDPQMHAAGQAGLAGGYYAELSIDPTMNLPHHQPHPQSQDRLQKHRRRSASPPNIPTPKRHRLRSTTYYDSESQDPAYLSILNSSHAGALPEPNLRRNSFFYVPREDRASVLLGVRALVSSLPSKSMDIPHHQQHSLAHLPVLYGGSNGSMSGTLGIPHSNTVHSLRRGSVVSLGTGGGYRSRLGLVVIPYLSDRRDSDGRPPPPAKPIKPVAPSTPLFKVPWSMEEDELLINRRSRELSFAELLILLPQRTEGEIWSRIDYLEKLRNGHRELVGHNRRRRRSSIGLDDVDDFYENVIELDDEDDEDERNLFEVDLAVPSHGRMRRKRTMSTQHRPE